MDTTNADWRIWAGIIVVPVLAFAVWFIADRFWLQEPVAAEIDFIHEGNLIKDNPGLEPDVWYLAYEEPGSPALSMPLLFDGESRCGPEGALGICDISFMQGERVRIEGVVAGEAVSVRTLIYQPVPPEEGTTVRLFFYNPERDTDADGNILCSQKGLVAVERVIPKTQTPLTDSIKLLLRGELSDEERAQGITTEFPLPGVALEKATIVNSVATLTFDDPQNRTGGGSCRAGVLWAQIQATATQFPTVSSARFEPEELFQP